MVQGQQFSYSPGQIEYKRTGINIGYLPRTTPLLIMSGDKEISGEVNEASQRLNLTSRVVNNVEFDWFEHDSQFVRFTTFVTGNLTAGVKGTPKVYTVADASIFHEGHICLNTSTNEQFRVISVDTTKAPDEVTMLPAFFQTAGTTVNAFPGALVDGASSLNTNGDTLMIISNAQKEGGSAVDIYNTDPTRRLQYCQIFRRGTGDTETSLNSENYNATTTPAERKRQVLGDLMEDIEDQMLFGKLNKEIVDGKPVRSFLGVREFVTTNNFTAASLVGGGADLDIFKWDEIGEIAYAGDDGRPSKQNKVALTGGLILRKLQDISRDTQDINIQPNGTELNIKAKRVHTAFGDIDVILHPKMNRPGLNDEMLILDRDQLEQGHLRNRQLRFRPNEQANDEDAQRGSWLAEMTFLPKNEKCHVRIRDIVPTFS